jgi:hypothetical protein
MGPHPGQARQPVLELRQLDLQPPLVRLGAAREDIKDQRRAVDDHDVELAFEVALLGRRQLAVDHDQVIAQLLAQPLDLVELALPDVGRRVRVAKPLGHRADDLNVDGLGEAGELVERVGSLPGLPRCLDRDQEGLFRPSGGVRERLSIVR